jgi:hypothetical protein
MVALLSFPRVDILERQCAAGNPTSRSKIDKENVRDIIFADK